MPFSEPLQYLWRHKLKTSGLFYLGGSSILGVEGLQSSNPWLVGIGTFSLIGNIFLLTVASGAKRSERSEKQDRIARTWERFAWYSFGGIGICFVGKGLSGSLNIPEIVQGCATLFGTSLGLWKPQPSEGTESRLKDFIKPLITGQWKAVQEIWKNIPPLRIDGAIALTASTIMLADYSWEAVKQEGSLAKVIAASLYVCGAGFLSLSARASEKLTP